MNERLHTSQKLYDRAVQSIPGGVNSPVRAFRSVGGTPIFMAKGEGYRITDVDGNEFIDFCCSWGPLIHGHRHPDIIKAIERQINRALTFGTPCEAEVELAEFVIARLKPRVPTAERIRFVSSGTEAVMSALRLARGFTGRNKILKFEGCYHGHVDSMLVKAGSGLVTSGVPDSAGVPAEFTEHTIVSPLDDLEAVREAVQTHRADLAAIILEPIPANNGLLLQRPEFLQELRRLCDESGALLIFDEVISGFRVAPGGAAEHYNIAPDLLTYGKIIGGGMPVGAFAGRADIFAQIAPDGPVYQAGTLSGNPVAMSAGLAQLRLLTEPVYKHLASLGELLKSDF
ncbi:MAG: glutamate-1-semialdehyde 2,1-aminomutase [Leptospirales bacterium]